MFLQPKKHKYKKIHKHKLNNFDYRSNELKFGTVGLKSKISGTITAKQLEAARQAISRKIKKKGKLWIRIFPHLPITSKPTEARMGKGKGNVKLWAAKVKKGTVLFEVCGVDKEIANNALYTGGAKLPVTTIIFD